MSEKIKGINTKMLHSYPVIDTYTGAASIPKYQTSTYDQKILYTDSQKYNYTRFGNPTVNALQKAVESLEGAEYGFIFSSGMAAISTTLMLLKKGEHIIIPKEVYGGTCQMARQILGDYGIEVSFIDYGNMEELENTIKENTKILYIETPSNPLLKISDIKSLVNLAKKYNLLTVVDNTFMTPLYQKPLELGCDIVVESMTKFINGHSDVLAGAIATNSASIASKIYLYQKNFGGILGVEDAWLILRGMKTLGLRIQKSVKNAELIAEFLSKHPKIKNVYYPGLKSHKNYEIHFSQATSGRAILSFELFSKNDIEKFIEKIEIPIFAVSLGGVESIISHPATMSHACLTEEERLEQGVTDNLLRFSCGIEDAEDLIEDLERALASL